jgi:hypothetical protein
MNGANEPDVVWVKRDDGSKGAQEARMPCGSRGASEQEELAGSASAHVATQCQCFALCNFMADPAGGREASARRQR